MAQSAGNHKSGNGKVESRSAGNGGMGNRRVGKGSAGNKGVGNNGSGINYRNHLTLQAR